MTPAGFPHSDIHGSTLASSSPWLFAGSRVLRRLLVPRHSPCALSTLTLRGRSFAARPTPGTVYPRGWFEVRGSFRHLALPHPQRVRTSTAPSLEAGRPRDWMDPKESSCEISLLVVFLDSSIVR
jgi:hypothetical protein